jgi:hypothetical protein
MNCRVELDVTGWHTTDKRANWQTVACDEMKLLVTEMPVPFPAGSGLDQVREFFRHVVTRREGALISCDPVQAWDPPLFRTVYKYPTGRGYAVTFEASLALPLGNVCLELLITASEDSVTGVREALVMRDLMKTAGISEREQLARNEIPIQWKFERYHPGTRGSWAYVISDDEQYDAAYPRHPLTRVRRWLRRIERTYRVVIIAEPPETSPAKDASESVLGRLRKTFEPKEPTTLGLGPASEKKLPQDQIQINTLPLQPMTFEEMTRELGFDVTSDAIMAEAIKKTPLSFPPLADRQKMYRNQRDAEMKKVIDAEAKVQSIREAGQKVAAELTPDSAKLILARIRASGRWLIKPEIGRLALTTFTSMVFFDDYTETKELPSEPVAVTIRDLFSRFGELRELGIDSLTIDRCPRCNDDRVTHGLDELPDEQRLLLMYGIHVAGRRYLVQEKLQAAMQETDTEKRMEILRHIIEHLNPGSVETRVEIAKMAITNRDAMLYEQCRGYLARYAPEQMALLPDIPG